MKRTLITAALMSLALGAGSAMATDTEVVNRVGAYDKGGLGYVVRPASEEGPAYQLTGKSMPAVYQTPYQNQTPRENAPAAWDIGNHTHHL